MSGLAHILQQHPELAVFLTLAVGFLVGKLRIGTFALGTVLGCLLAGVIIGQLDIQVSPTVKAAPSRPRCRVHKASIAPVRFRNARKIAKAPAV